LPGEQNHILMLGCQMVTKIQIWVNFGGPCSGRCWYILWTFGLCTLRPLVIFYGHLVYALYGHLLYFMDIWYIFPILVCCTNNNLATLVRGPEVGLFLSPVLKMKLCSTCKARPRLKGYLYEQ
jgi:hypothetical protein